jgi:hypothetical protein
MKRSGLRSLIYLIFTLIFVALPLIVVGCKETPTETGFLEGRVHLGPRSEEEIGQPYPPEIYQTRKIMIYDADRVKLIKQVDIDSLGDYKVELPAGTYTIDINYVGNDYSDDVPRTLRIEPGIHIMCDIFIDMGTATS